MEIKYKENPRRLTHLELSLIHKLLEPNFTGKEDLLTQLEGLEARLFETDDDHGSIELLPKSGIKANRITTRVPVELRSEDEDGVSIEVLLHVVDGFIDELEILKVDGSPISKFPDIEYFTIVLN